MPDITRRNFASGTIAALAGLGGASFAMAAEAEPNRVCQILGIEKPVIQGPMVGLTSTELVAAVSNAGGLGVLPAGSGAPDLESIQAVRALTDKPFACAVVAVTEEVIAMFHDEGVNVLVVSDWPTPTYENGWTVATPDLIRQLKGEGFTVIYKGINSTVEALHEIEDAGADIIVVIGKGAGGTGPAMTTSLASLLALFKGQFNVPLIASGGIVNADTARGAAALGAEGAYCGTRFLASVEAPTSDSAKQALLEARSQDMIEIVGTFFATRVTRTPTSEEFIASHSLLPTDEEGDDILAFAAGVYAGMASGKLENGINADDAVDLITDVLTVQEIVDDIASGFMA